MRRWELEASEEWDDLEAFRALPKPKKLIGNEACHAVWPYSTLMERRIAIHPMTKSIYVYYPQHSLTPMGEVLRLVTRQFSWEYLVPITFHNSQCYVETELLVEYSDNPWIVVNCMDGRNSIIPVNEKLFKDIKATTTPSVRYLERFATALLEVVQEESGKLCDAVQPSAQLRRELHDRPLQSQYVRVDYQWFGETPEDRAQHTVQWTREDAAAQPTISQRHIRAFGWANVRGWAPVAPWMKDAVHKESRRLMKSSKGVGWYNLNSFHATQRNMANYSSSTGLGPQGKR